MKLVTILVLMLFSINTLAATSVHGYKKRNGTYVQPHHRSDPNHSVNDNWSKKGNTNPYTGKKGTKK